MSPGRRLQEISWKTSLGRVLDNVLTKVRRDFHFRPILDVFETKNKTFLRRIYDVFVPVGQSNLKNSKILGKNYVISIGDSMVNGINEEFYPIIVLKSRLKITQTQQREKFLTLTNLKYPKNLIYL